MSSWGLYLSTVVQNNPNNINLRCWIRNHMRSILLSRLCFIVMRFVSRMSLIMDFSTRRCNCMTWISKIVFYSMVSSLELSIYLWIIIGVRSFWLCAYQICMKILINKSQLYPTANIIFSIRLCCLTMPVRISILLNLYRSL